MPWLVSADGGGSAVDRLVRSGAGSTQPRDQRQLRDPGRDHIVVLSHGLWARKFASDPAVVGKTIRLNREDYNTLIALFARGAANRVVFMADGAIVESAEPVQFFENPQTDRAKDFLGKILHH